MEIAEVQDEESLKRYLEGLPDGYRLRTARRVAFRAAARVLPLASDYFASNPSVDGVELTPTPIFGAIAVASVSVLWPAPKILYNKIAFATSRAANTSHSRANPSATASANAAAAAAFANPRAVSFASFATDTFDAFECARHDLSQKVVNDRYPFIGLWDGFDQPENIKSAWVRSKLLFDNDRNADWSFWVAWYERVLVGGNFLANDVHKILSALEEGDWKKGPAHVNPMFDGVLAKYREQDSTPLAEASPFDFTFDGYYRVMRLVGISDNMRHLRDPVVVQAFLDDAEQVRDLFQDFADDAASLSGGGNFAGLLRRKAENILKELQRTKDYTHLRAEFLVLQASELELFAKDAKARTDLGDTLADRLDVRIEQLKGLCRLHFGPSYVTLAPLSELTLDQVDQDEVVRIFDDAIARLHDLPTGGLVALDAEGFAILDEMRRELRENRAAIAEATTEEFRKILEGRLAQGAGALGLSLTKFYQRSVAAGGDLVRGADAVIRTNRRLSGLDDILDQVLNLPGGGAP
ncbi:hypothetical protein LGQ03_00110 [Loktanella sp. TSTF-M6]|uniref:Uncharacterized protein n=1 Tax=Loktanella gaetbuli TaxID=2881335 RepID=A0ABS8BPS3_9RHOB|nr:hypothetical protein [Loktanella gaetbuli]MCB5197632.1 hypothetical protein [Loktanella gaetbuli]